MSRNDYSPSVQITATVRKTSEKPTFQIQIIRFIIAVLGCCGSVFTTLSCLDITVDKTMIFFLIIGMCILTNTFRLRKEIALCTLFASTGAYIIGTAILKDKICAGLAGVLNVYTAAAREKYRTEPFIHILEPELVNEHITIFIIMSVILICLFVGYLFVRLDSGLYAAFVLFAPAIAVLAYGFEPDPLAFTALITAVVALAVVEYSVSNSSYRQQFIRYGIQCAGIAAVISILCLWLIIGITRASGFERPQKLNELFYKADNYLESGEIQHSIRETFSQIMGDPYIYGAINHGKLDEFGNIRFDFKTVLQVTMPRSLDTIYLRGFVGSVYTGRSWEELSSGKLRELEEITDGFTTDGLSPLLFDSYNLKNAPGVLPNYSFTVKNIAASTDYLYLPYNLVPESVSRYTITDNSHFTGSSETYFGQIYDPDSYYGYQNLFRKRWSIPASLVDDEAAYRNFVYEIYLDIPDTFSPEEMFNQNYYEYITAEEIQTGKSTLDEMTVFTRKLYYIKEWLRDNCNYSLTTEPLPRGEDFVNHFLKYKEGSCSHFATTAVLMCRYAGIPARYVEGYIIAPHDSDMDIPEGTVITVDVEDSHGHAWVEVYIDGYGWYPMEFTSGYANIRTAFPTETTVTETEAESSASSDESETLSAAETDVTITGSEHSAPQPQEITTGTTITQNDKSDVTEVTTIPSETGNTTQAGDDKINKPPSVGFGIFGIEGEKKVDIVYDLTWVLIVVLVIAVIPLAVIIRRTIIVSRYKAAAVPTVQVSKDYKRFCKLIRLMDMPEQGGMSYSEYGEALSQRSPLLADGCASQIISLALKASFGGVSITRDEAHEMRLAVTSLIKRHYASLSSFGKFKLKFVYCLI